MQKGFWGELKFPIVGLSPMDGVTDAPWRFIAKKYGMPDVIYTEFVSVEGLWRIHKRQEMDHKIWKELLYDESERPVVAQLFGSDPDSFYAATKIVCGLRFDGIDINMGCPSPGLEKSGGGAGLMRDQGRAAAVIEATRRGVEDYDNDKEIPVTLKTRIGSVKPDELWWKFLASQEMPVVAMHGRTFKQLYSGEADWDVLFKAGEIIRESGALFLANGDVKKILNGGKVVELNSGKEIDIKCHADGILIGKNAMGNPWIFRKDGYEPNTEERLKVAIEHAKKYEEVFMREKETESKNLKAGIASPPEADRNDGKGKFFPMRKHLAWYAHGFPEAGELRRKLVTTNSSEDVKKIVSDFLEKNERFV